MRMRVQGVNAFSSSMDSIGWEIFLRGKANLDVPNATLGLVFGNGWGTWITPALQIPLSKVDKVAPYTSAPPPGTIASPTILLPF
jgi:hypothetical protein